MIKYRTHKYSTNIEQVEAIRETDKFLWMPYWSGNNRRVRRTAKESNYEQFHDTFEGAKQHLVSRSFRRIAAASQQLKQACDEWKEAKALTNEDEENPDE